MKHKLKGDRYRNVWLDGKKLLPDESLKIRNHSPNGFSWGYSGSGPAQLALAIMLKLTGKLGGYQDFKREVIAGIPDGPFEIKFFMNEGVCDNTQI